MKEPVIRKTLSVPVSRHLLNRRYCLERAEEIIARGSITGMSRKAIAKELYFHAAAWHACRFLKRYRISLDKIMYHADPIDLADNGDTPLRRAVYFLVWYFPFHPGQRDTAEK